MDAISNLMLTAGLGWASGLRLYAVCFALGLGGKMGWVSLPGQLSLLSHDWLLIASGVMCACEFIADKVPLFDSIWDALHTFVRGPGAAILAYFAVDASQPEATQALMALFAGTLATGTHLTKAGTRAAINHSPEPFSNWAASFTEDFASLGIVWLAWQHPYICTALLLVFICLMVWLLPKLWRLIIGVLRKLTASTRGRSAIS